MSARQRVAKGPPIIMVICRPAGKNQIGNRQTMNKVETPGRAYQQLFLRIVVVAAAFCGRVSMLAFLVFIFSGPFDFKLLQFNPDNWWLWDSLLSALFFIQHSAMLRRGMKRRMAKLIPPYCNGAVFTLASAAALCTIMLLWQPSGVMLVELSGPWRWFANSLFCAAVAGTGWGAWALLPFDPLGTAPIKAHLAGRPQPAPAPFAVRGPYLWVRHPLYFFVLVMLWSRPDLTADRLLFNLMWSGWIYAGTLLEEKDLLAEFGDVYRRYQAIVPMLLPWKGYNSQARDLNPDQRR